MEENFQRSRSVTRSMSMTIDGPLPDVFNILSDFNQSNLDSQSLRILSEIKKISDFQKETIQEILDKTQAMIADLVWQRDQMISRIKEECSTRAIELKVMIGGFINNDPIRRGSILKPIYNMALLDFTKDIIYTKPNWLKKCKICIKFSQNGLEKIQNSKSLSQVLLPMYEEISSAESTTSLLINRKIGDDGARQLSHILPYYKNLTVLTLVSNCLGPRGGKYLASSIPQLKKLYKLSINNDRIKDGILSIVRALPSLPYLEEIYLSTGVFYEREAGEIGLALSLMTNVKNVSLLGGVLETKGTEKLCYGLMFMTQLRTLDLSGNSLGPGGAELVQSSLQHLSQLECLKLSANSFGTQGGGYMGKLMVSLESLKELWLNSNSLGDQGVSELVDQGTCSLQVLRLQDNVVSNLGAKQVLKSCCEWKSLQVLDLSWNSIDDSIVQAIKNNDVQFNCLHLDLCGMNISENIWKGLGVVINV